MFTGKLYNNVDYVDERHRHRYEVNPSLVESLEKEGLRFVGHDDDGERMEIMELEGTIFLVMLAVYISANISLP